MSDLRGRIFRSWRMMPTLALGGAIVLLIAGIVIAIAGERLYREQKIREVTSQAEILAATVTAAVAFDDVAAAQEYAEAVRTNRDIEAAGIYDENAQMVAGYGVGEAKLPPTLDELRPPDFEGSQLVVTAPIEESGTRIGAVQLRAATEPLARRVSRYGAAALLTAMGALLLAVLGAAQAALTRANRELRRQAKDLAVANNELRIQIEEREKAEEALRQSQKMEAIGQLTGGVAHDFNNLLMVASSGLDLMDRTQDPARRQMLKDSIRQAVDRGSSLTRQLLAFSRRTALKPEVVDLKAQVEGMEVLLERSLREDVAVELRLPDHLWPVEVDPHQLELALLNISVNARDAMPNGGRIVIAAENLPGYSDGALSGDLVRLTVSDTGAGMPPEMLSRVFEPFFTTKERGQGTGLGLSQVYGFTRSSGGDVRIESREGEGTTVALLLPRTDKAFSVRVAEEDHAPRKGRAQGRVLLVEDDEGVAALVGEMLREMGYEPTRAAAAAEALVLLEKDKAFDLVFSDMVMPGEMDGMDLAREIARRRPGLPIVLTTGFSEAAAVAGQEGLRLLVKPYRMEALASELEAALAERRC